MQEEFHRRKKQLQDLCFAVKADSVSDMQDILCCMVLSECVYKVRFQFFINFCNCVLLHFSVGVIGVYVFNLVNYGVILSLLNSVKFDLHV